MSLRAKLNKNPGLVALLVIVAAAAAIWIGFRSMSDRGGTADMPSKHFFTVDDGKTLVTVSASEIPPIMLDGKEAVRAHVFSCDGGKTQKVEYLEKYTDSFRKSVASKPAPPEGEAKGGGTPPLQSPSAAFNMLVKKPGANEWTPFTSPQASKITEVMCPNGNPLSLSEEYPK